MSKAMKALLLFFLAAVLGVNAQQADGYATFLANGAYFDAVRGWVHPPTNDTTTNVTTTTTTAAPGSATSSGSTSGGNSTGGSSTGNTTGSTGSTTGGATTTKAKGALIGGTDFQKPGAFVLACVPALVSLWVM